MKLITRGDILTGTKSFLEPVEDISLDIPHIWLYIAEIIAPVIETDNLKLIQLKTLCPDHVHWILEELLPYLETTYGAAYVKTLLKSNEINTLVTKTEQISDKLKNFVATISNLPAEAVISAENLIFNACLNGNGFIDLLSPEQLVNLENYLQTTIVTPDDPLFVVNIFDVQFQLFANTLQNYCISHNENVRFPVNCQIQTMNPFDYKALFLDGLAALGTVATINHFIDFTHNDYFEFNHVKEGRRQLIINHTKRISLGHSVIRSMEMFVTFSGQWQSHISTQGTLRQVAQIDAIGSMGLFSGNTIRSYEPFRLIMLGGH
ncbi:hypothetical protein HA402_015153 [Bradysia odoriphaga]|nr:hypothetical protein HA402_015153 [Bradysia odoriphaga]